MNRPPPSKRLGEIGETAILRKGDPSAEKGGQAIDVIPAKQEYVP